MILDAHFIIELAYSHSDNQIIVFEIENYENHKAKATRR